MNLLLQIGNLIDKLGLVAYFSAEIITLLAVVLNILIYLFMKRKNNIGKISDQITFGFFSLNFSCLLVVYLVKFFTKNNSFFTIGDLFVFNSDALFSRVLLNLFFVFFILITYKLNRKARFKVPLVNINLLLLYLSSSFLVCANNTLIGFLLFEACVLLIYRYATDVRIRKQGIYSLNYISINLISSVLFFVSYIVSFAIKDELQLSIIHVCISCAILLKTGLFPVYNYTIGKKYKNNIPWSILIYCLIPLLGISLFAGFLNEVNIRSEVYSITMVLFAIFLVVSFALNVLKTKNIVRFLANSSLLFASFVALSLLTLFDETLVYYNYISAFVLLSIFSYICILKINDKDIKINIPSIRGVFVKNRIFAFSFAISLLVLGCCFPTRFSYASFEIVKMIYEFDKMGSYLAFVVFLGLLFVFLNAIRIIKAIYAFDNQKSYPKFKKGTIFNYLVPCVIILFLFVGLFL